MANLRGERAEELLHEVLDQLDQLVFTADERRALVVRIKQFFVQCALGAFNEE